MNYTTRIIVGEVAKTLTNIVDRKRGRFIEVLQAVVESVPVPEFPDVEINPEFNFGIVNFNKREADKDDW